MILKELIEWLEERDPNQVVLDGFGCPHSDRGNYADLAFNPVKRTTYGEMLSNASRALGCTFGGWKGGEFKMDIYSKCLIGHVGECGEDITSAHLRLWQLGKCRTWTLCSEQLPPVDGDGLWSGILFTDDDIRLIAFYDEVEGLGYWEGLYSGVVVIIDPSKYDRVYWRDYPELPEV